MLSRGICDDHRSSRAARRPNPRGGSQHCCDRGWRSRCPINPGARSAPSRTTFRKCGWSRAHARRLRRSARRLRPLLMQTQHSWLRAHEPYLANSCAKRRISSSFLRYAACSSHIARNLAGARPRRRARRSSRCARPSRAPSGRGRCVVVLAWTIDRRLRGRRRRRSSKACPSRPNGSTRRNDFSRSSKLEMQTRALFARGKRAARICDARMVISYFRASA
jgi:hypothetical protein